MSTAPSLEPGAAVPPVRLLFATGKLGCILPLMAAAALFFGGAAVRPGMLESSGRHGWIADAIRPMTWHGVNIPALLITGWLLWEFVRFGWRWADRIAVEVRSDGLLFHPTVLRRRLLPWRDVEEVRFLPRGAATRAPTMWIRASGGTISVKPVDNENGSADRFAAAVRARIGGGTFA